MPFRALPPGGWCTVTTLDDEPGHDPCGVPGVSTPHRNEAFRGFEFVIDRLKQDMPIWKKGFAEDGEVWEDLRP